MANEFDTLFAARKKGRNEKPAAEKAETKSALAEPLQGSIATPESSAPSTSAPEPKPEVEPTPVSEPVPVAKQVAEFAPEPAPTPKKKKKRGRPATGKRSDEGWIGRTYYIQEKTDIDIAEELVALRRQGVSLDKSELVDALLSTWVSWRKGKDANNCFGEFSPRRKDD